jgi:Sigma-54, DNA binding domain
LSHFSQARQGNAAWWLQNGCVPIIFPYVVPDILDKRTEDSNYDIRLLEDTKQNEAGYPVARRTVTKYRKGASIPSSRQRKDWA